MSEIARRDGVACGWYRLADAWRRALLGIVDGFAAARRYHRLAAMSDAELGRAGLTRLDLPWLAVSGGRAPQFEPPALPGGARLGRPVPQRETFREGAGTTRPDPAAAQEPASS